MPRSISAANQTALERRSLVARDFLTVFCRDRITNDPVEFSFWSDVGNVTAEVIDPDTAAPVSRIFKGAGVLIQISDIPLVANLTVQSVDIQVSQIDDSVNAAFRIYDMRQARVEVFRGLLSVETHRMVDAAECRFVGFVDQIDVRTPREGNDGAVAMTCVSHTQEMTRSNPETRSDASQRKRAANDDFLKDAGTIGDQEFFWGRKNGKIASGKKNNKGNSSNVSGSYDGPRVWTDDGPAETGDTGPINAGDDNFGNYQTVRR